MKYLPLMIIMVLFFLAVYGDWKHETKPVYKVVDGTCTVIKQSCEVRKSVTGKILICECEVSNER